MDKKINNGILQFGDNKNSKQKNILVIGANSQIGSALINNQLNGSYGVYGTTRHVDRTGKNILFYDLAKPEVNLDFSSYECVIICAAITNIEHCESDPKSCERINSINTIKLIEKCIESNCFVIFLSSNAVFDGSKQFYKHSDPPNPITFYGKSKLLVENYIQSLNANQACILRLTKVITESSQFIQNWINAAEKGEEIKAFSNKFISPINIKDVIDSIMILVERKKSGIFQLGGNEEISFFDYANKIFSSNPKIMSQIVDTLSIDPANLQYNSLITFLPYEKNSYSFEGSDLIISSLLRNVSRGIYIDVGANHPVIQNNTYYFYQKGWRGLAVDGNDDFKHLWINNRPRDIFITDLVTDRIRDVEFSIYPDRTLSTMDSTSVQRYEERFLQSEIIKKQVTTTTLEYLKNQYFNEQEIHLLSIDVEGEDLNCLIGANLRLWQPGVIVIEAKNLTLYDISNNDIVEYLTSFGYRLIAKTPLDAFFVYPQKHYLQWIPKSIIN